MDLIHVRSVKERVNDMKRKSRIFFIVLIIILVSGCVGIILWLSNNSNIKNNKQLQNINTISQDNDDTYNYDEDDDLDTYDEMDITVKKEKVYDENKVKIWVLGYDTESDELNFKVKNNSGKTLGFNAHAYAINGVMTGNNVIDMDFDVAKGKTVTRGLIMDNMWLYEMSVHEIKCIDILFYAYDNDKVFDTGQIRVKTSAYDSTSSKEYGKEIYNSRGIRVEYLDRYKDYYKFALINDSGKYIDYDIENVAFNNYTCSDDDFNDVLETAQIITFNNCQSIFWLDVKKDFFKKNKIKNVEKIEFSLAVREKESSKKEYKTGMIQTTEKDFQRRDQEVTREWMIQNQKALLEKCANRD